MIDKIKNLFNDIDNHMQIFTDFNEQAEKLINGVKRYVRGG